MGNNSTRKFGLGMLKENQKAIIMEACGGAEVGVVRSAPEVRHHGRNTWTNF